MTTSLDILMHVEVEDTNRFDLLDRISNSIEEVSLARLQKPNHLVALSPDKDLVISVPELRTGGNGLRKSLSFSRGFTHLVDNLCYFLNGS